MKRCRGTYIIYILISIIAFGACADSSTENEQLFESAERFSDDFTISTGINKVIVSNPIGFIFLYGISDSLRSRYTLDRTVKSSDKALSVTDMKKILLIKQTLGDSLICEIDYPNNLKNFYLCNFSFDIFYKKDVVVRKTNQGVQVQNMTSNVNIESDTWPVLVKKHSGNLNITTTGGNITIDMNLPQYGTCYCNTGSGNIYVRIPRNTSSAITIKSLKGSVRYKNLEFSPDINSGREVRGKIGSGDGIISLYSTSGNIILEGVN